MYKYGKTSLKHIETLRPMMQKVCHRAIAIANERKLEGFDFGISAGARTAEEQNTLWQQGRTAPGKVITNADGYIDLSAHQRASAIDFFAIVDGKADYDPGRLALTAMCFAQAANEFDMLFRWGGNFTTIIDAGHFECY